jgi:hypothetical protein
MADRPVRSSRLDGTTGTGERGRLTHLHATSQDELKRSAWERAMKRLRMTVRLLAALLLALAVRVAVSGINVVIGLTGGIVAGLLIVSLLLARQGRRLEPTSRRERRG